MFAPTKIVRTVEDARPYNKESEHTHEYFLFILRHGKLDYKRHIIGLIFCVECRLVAAYLTAFSATVDYYKSLLWVGLGTYRLKLSTTGVCSVTRVYIHVKRPQTMRAVVTRGISKRLYLPSTVNAYKRIVVFGKSLLLHILSFKALATKTLCPQEKPQMPRPRG